jgi:RNA polymerase sigma-70 factor (ECF subfamily)
MRPDSIGSDLLESAGLNMANNQLRQGQITRLLMQHRTALYGYIFACVRNHTDTEDIFQNVSVAVTESFAQLQDEKGFLPWAREIARRRVLAHRRQGCREVVCDPEVVRRLADAAEQVESRESTSGHREALMACLESLPDQSRRLIMMRYDGTGDAGALASRLGRSVQSIYAQIKRIKLVLRECVQRRMSLEAP